MSGGLGGTSAEPEGIAERVRFELELSGGEFERREMREGLRSERPVGGGSRRVETRLDSSGGRVIDLVMGDGSKAKVDPGVRGGDRAKGSRASVPSGMIRRPVVESSWIKR